MGHFRRAHCSHPQNADSGVEMRFLGAPAQKTSNFVKSGDAEVSENVER
jgi:hypothetical protein